MAQVNAIGGTRNKSPTSRAELLPGAREEVEAAVLDLMQETRCPICLDFFTNPRSAPCQHNFCEECIWEYIKDSHSECPTCRNPGTNRRSLSRNNQLRNITDVVKRLANALGLASPEEPLLGGNEGNNGESAWGNGQKLAEKHVGRRHAKGRRGGASKGGKCGVADSHADPGSSVMLEIRGQVGSSHCVDSYATPASRPTNAEGKAQLGGLGWRQQSGHKREAIPLSEDLALSARATAAKCRRSETVEGWGGEAGETGPERPMFGAKTANDDDPTTNDAALAVALGGYDVGMRRRRRGQQHDGNACAGSISGPTRAHQEDRDGASSSKRPCRAGPLRGQAESVDVASGAEWPKAPRVVMFTGFKGPELVELQVAVSALGGECVPNFRAGVTHVVCACDTQGHAQRTLKYSLALISGAALVTPEWLRACRASRSWREPWEDVHFVNGCVVHGTAHPGPRQRAIHPDPVFRGKCFYLAGNFAKPNPTREELTLLLKIGGATVVQHEPNLRSIIAVCGEDIQEKSYEHLRAIHATMVSAAFVMDSISLHCLQPEDSYAPEA